MTESMPALDLNSTPQPIPTLSAGRPRFPRRVGQTLATATDLGDVTPQQAIFGYLDRPGAVHVYRSDCPAGQRLRIQVLAPVLQSGRALTPAVALLAHGLPDAAPDTPLPVSVPAGYVARSLPPPDRLREPMVDWWTRARYFAGPVIDERTLVGGRSYIVVWNPEQQPGKYLLRVGYGRSAGRVAALWNWWRVRSWFGMSRVAGYVLIAAVLLMAWLGLRLLAADESAAGASAQDVAPSEE